jgi:hypothetical protein
MAQDDDSRMHPDQWYVAVRDRTVGPVTTKLLIRGLENGKVPPHALVCPVGAAKWDSVATVQPFVDTVRRSFPPPARSQPQPPPSADDYEDEETLVRQSLTGAARRHPDETAAEPTAGAAAADPVPSLYGMDVAFAKAAAAAPHLAGHAAGSTRLGHPATPVGPAPATQPAVAPLVQEPGAATDSPADFPGEESGMDIPVEVDGDFEEPPTEQLDWNEPFVEQTEVAQGVTLPAQQVLLQSLAATGPAVLAAETPMWNLALCVAFGAEGVATAAAQAFFDTVATQGTPKRLAWIARVLLSRGFLPSGIPQEAGLRGVRVLRDNCPPELRVQFENDVLR